MSENRLLQKILILTPNLNGADGISEVSRQVVRAFCAKQSDHLSEVTVWSLTDVSSEARRNSWPGILYRPAFNKLRFAFWGLQAAVRSNRGMLVVILHVHLTPVVLPLIARGARIVLFLHGIEVWSPLGVLETAVVRRAWIVMANSHHTVTRFKAVNPAHASREVQVCPLGASLRMAEAPSRPAAGIFALIVGRLAAEERYKGHDLLLEIWPQVIAEIPDAALFVAGDGDDRARLEAKAVGLGLRNSVKFLGRVSDETLAGLYRDCAFFVMPSRHEGFGLVFLEAMRAGKACIGGVGAAAEVIEDGVTGLVVEPERPEQVLSAVVRLFREPETRRQMGAVGAERVARQFTEEQFQRRFRTLLRLEPGTAAFVR
jgi:phosphatidylinositol alpha-1,6-mannosyltransferase